MKRWEERNPKKRSGHDLNRRVLKEQKIDTEEISSLVRIPRTLPASGNRMRQKLQSFELFSARSQLKHFYARAGLYHPMERSKYYPTRLDVDDGWSKITPMCREYTQCRND